MCLNLARAMTTKIKLIAAAEECFIEQGFNATSLREITKRAGTNVASINYHFGGKKQLIQAVFERYLSAYNASVARGLVDIKEHGHIEISQLVGILFERLSATEIVASDGPRIFIRLLSLAYSEHQGHLRKFIAREYAQTFSLVIELFSQVFPSVGRSHIFWLIHYMIGSLVFTVNSMEALNEISEAEFGKQLELDELMPQLSQFVIGGLVASSQLTHRNLGEESL